MSVIRADTFWSGATIGCEAELRPWLHDHGSLTQRIQQRCDVFAVWQMCNGLARVAQDESALLGVAPRRFAYTREVFLYADHQPVVFAHSTCAAQSIRGAWRAVAGLGNRPLGALLFAHPLVQRLPLHYQALRTSHPLYRQATTVLSHSPAKLWARRSLFYLHNAPLLVTEVFLPEILRLQK
jgi:chorismate--pyruvate lyase